MLFSVQSSLFIPVDTNGSDNSIPMAYLTLDHQLQVQVFKDSHDGVDPLP